MNDNQTYDSAFKTIKVFTKLGEKLNINKKVTRSKRKAKILKSGALRQEQPTTMIIMQKKKKIKIHGAECM